MNFWPYCAAEEAEAQSGPESWPGAHGVEIAELGSTPLPPAYQAWAPRTELGPSLQIGPD